MSWLSNIFGGGVTAVTKGIERVGGVFTENREARGARVHERDMASLDQFASEFVARSHRSWWDSFVDGLNRLPRPLITLGVLAFFVLAPIDPERFTHIAHAYSLIPPGLWALFSVIVAFYFGGRLQLTNANFAISKQQIATAKELAAMRKPIADDEIPAEENKVVAHWKASRS